MMRTKFLHVFTIFPTAKFFDGQFGYLSDRGFEQIVMSADADTEDFCKKNKVRFIPLEISRRMSPFADMKTIKNLISVIRKEKPDVVVGHTPKGAMVTMIAGWLARVPVRIYFRHGVIYTTAHGKSRNILKFIERFTACLATNVINVSHSLSRLAVRDRLNSDKKQTVFGQGTCGGINVISNFNPDKYSKAEIQDLRKSLGVSEDEFVVGFVGRLCKDKGINELIEGFELFREKNPNIKTRLLLVGPYDSRDILKDNIKEIIDNSPYVTATGGVERNQIAKHYMLMDVFAFPSYREGFGMSVIEASAMKLPILVSHSHGCEDSIVEHVTGEYIGIDEEAIAEKLQMMLDSSLRNRLGENGRKWVLENFEQTKLWPLIHDTYFQILSSH